MCEMTRYDWALVRLHFRLDMIMTDYTTWSIPPFCPRAPKFDKMISTMFPSILFPGYHIHGL
jgi:hypothetical protein